MAFSATYVRVSDLYISSGENMDLVNTDFTVEFWWNPATLVAGEDQTFWQENHSLGGTPIRLWKTDAAGVNKLRLRVQEVGGAAPLATEHVEIEWDINALVGTSTWVHLAVVFDISQAVASIAELFVDSVSQGNGTVISGTDCSSIVVRDNGLYIGSDGAGAAVDGQLFNMRIFADKRTSTEISDNYLLVATGLMPSIVLNVYKGGQHHQSGVGSTEITPMTEQNGTIAFAANLPTGVSQSVGTGDGGHIASGGVIEGVYSGEGLNALLGGVAPIALEGYSTVAYSGVPGYLTGQFGSSVGGTGVSFRMRGMDSDLARCVYWSSTSIDTLGDDYPGNSAALSDVVVSEVIGD